MNAKLLQLAKRREALIEQAAKQRAAISKGVQPWRSTLARADQGVAVLRYLKSHPIWLAAGSGLLLAILGPGRAWRWLGRGWIGLQMLNQLRSR